MRFNGCARRTHKTAYVIQLMNRLAGQLLLWLLVAALPVQGMAAVIKSNCGQTHPAISVTDSVGDSAATQHLHDVHDHRASSHSNAQVDLHISASQLQAADVGEANTTDLQSGHHCAAYCSACVACCMGGVAPPHTFSLVSLPDSVAVVAVPSAVSYLGFIPPSLDRPPKTLSA